MSPPDDRDADERKACASKSQIRSMLHMSQVKDFAGLEFGRVRPSDIDGCIMFAPYATSLAATLAVFIEVKHFDPPAMEGGQAQMYARLCHGLRCGGMQAYALVGVHDAASPNVIQVAAADVRWIYDEAGWRRPRASVSVLEAVTQYRRIDRLRRRL